MTPSNRSGVSAFAHRPCTQGRCSSAVRAVGDRHERRPTRRRADGRPRRRARAARPGHGRRGHGSGARDLRRSVRDRDRVARIGQQAAEEPVRVGVVGQPARDPHVRRRVVATASAARADLERHPEADRRRAPPGSARGACSSPLVTSICSGGRPVTARVAGLGQQRAGALDVDGVGPMCWSWPGIAGGSSPPPRAGAARPVPSVGYGCPIGATTERDRPAARGRRRRAPGRAGSRACVVPSAGRVLGQRLVVGPRARTGVASTSSSPVPHSAGVPRPVDSGTAPRSRAGCRGGRSSAGSRRSVRCSSSMLSSTNGPFETSGRCGASRRPRSHRWRGQG